MINTSTSILEPTPRISPSLSPLHNMTSSQHHVTSPQNLVSSSQLFVSSSPNQLTSQPLMVSSSSPFISGQLNGSSHVMRGFQTPFLGAPTFLPTQRTSPVVSSPKSGSDKSTQTLTSPGPASPGAPDPALFCNVLCNMLVDRIKDTLQEAMKTYSTDSDKVDKMKGIVTEALNSAGSDLDKKLSIVSVESLMQRPTITDGKSAPSLPEMPGAIPDQFPGVSKPNPFPAPDTNGPVSDYINRLSFIYGLSRPSMFNPYVKSQAPRQEGEEKENVPELSKMEEEEEGRNEESKAESRMEVETASSEQLPVGKQDTAGDEDVNIVDDVEDDIEPESDPELNRSFEEMSNPSTAEPSFSSPSLSHTTPITPIPLNLSPTSIHEKIQASLATNGFIDPSVQYELQKLLLSAAIAQGNIPAFPSTLQQTTKDCEPRSEIPVMIPSNGGFFDKREYNCQHCDASFSYGSKLRAHMICVHSIKSYQCRQCRKSFLDKEEYVKHLDLHPQRKFQCDKCPSSFDKQHQLSLHYRSHTNEKPYRCQICQRQFAVNDALIRHMRIHTGERPYACNVCGKRFAQKSGLTYHSYLHTGNRPYKCTTCGQGFVHRQALKQHLMKNHLNEQVGRILNSNSNTIFNPPQSSSGLSWEKDSVVTAEAMKRAFPWETKEQGSSGPFKLEGMAS
ncbi:zinc finger and BTB domain-containing protein 16-A-like isoform X1 [Bolinopsis microptera]|uniref:zinc finger and BTB domain-containing protein 16-A-like isoform X1 n=1 Tax=Bolinopsis microptera TaxID=2820187 RepID=UPI003078C04D